jgi:hypothetical protein
MKIAFADMCTGPACAGSWLSITRPNPVGPFCRPSSYRMRGLQDCGSFEVRSMTAALAASIGRSTSATVTYSRVRSSAFAMCNCFGGWLTSLRRDSP